MLSAIGTNQQQNGRRCHGCAHAGHDNTPPESQTQPRSDLFERPIIHTFESLDVEAAASCFGQGTHDGYSALLNLA
jgi:hypothetical protein